jgi:hypothetical protein
MKKTNALFLVVGYFIVWAARKLNIVKGFPVPDFNHKYDETML